MKKLLLALVLAFASISAFAGDIYPTVDGYQVYLPSCGGTIQINNGGANQQLNAVLRNVQNCSNVTLQDGRHYEMNQPQGSRGGSYTVLTASQLSPGTYSTIVTISSDSGKHYDRAIVYFTVTR